jgi:hypothetical protein
MKVNENRALSHLTKTFPPKANLPQKYKALMTFIAMAGACSVFSESIAQEISTEIAVKKPEEMASQQAELAMKESQKQQEITKTSYVIETRVQGSQEQPKVIYIMPWQENDEAVSIQEQLLQVSLPQLAPVNPKHFKNKLTTYYQKKTLNRQ